MFNTLATVPNNDFGAHIRDERRAWELGGMKSADEVISEEVTIYNNSVSSGWWETKDPKNAKIVALTTRIDELVEQQTKLAALATQHNPRSSRFNNVGGSQQAGNRIQPIEQWRFTET